jgi:hypothetical protein
MVSFPAAVIASPATVRSPSGAEAPATTHPDPSAVPVPIAGRPIVVRSWSDSDHFHLRWWSRSRRCLHDHGWSLGLHLLNGCRLGCGRGRFGLGGRWGDWSGRELHSICRAVKPLAIIVRSARRTDVWRIISSKRGIVREHGSDNLRRDSLALKLHNAAGRKIIRDGRIFHVGQNDRIAHARVR